MASTVSLKELNDALAAHNHTGVYVQTTDVVTAATPNKILKLDASGKLPASITGTAANVAWTGVTGTPTTLAGYKISDAAPLIHTHAVISISQPTVGLIDGLIWYNPSTDLTKIYLNSAFRDIGGIIKGTLNLSGTLDTTHRLVIPVGTDKWA